MKILGVKFKTRKELKANIAKLENELSIIKNAFPFTIGQIVYDVQLRNEKGRYIKKNASLEHSLVKEIVVDKKNYFGLVERYERQDVFLSREAANAYLKEVCIS